MEVEQFEKWQLVEGITSPVARAQVQEEEEGLSVIMIFSEINGGLDTELQINFGRVPAYTVHEEFVHPWTMYDTGPIPKLEGKGKWKDWSFPLLTVKNSNWLNSFSDSQLINYQNCIHYRLLTMDQTVDVLCNRVIEATWKIPQTT